MLVSVSLKYLIGAGYDLVWDRPVSGGVFGIHTGHRSRSRCGHVSRIPGGIEHQLTQRWSG